MKLVRTMEEMLAVLHSDRQWIACGLERVDYPVVSVEDVVYEL